MMNKERSCFRERIFFILKERTDGRAQVLLLRLSGVRQHLWIWKKWSVLGPFRILAERRMSDWPADEMTLDSQTRDG